MNKTSRIKLLLFSASSVFVTKKDESRIPVKLLRLSFGIRVYSPDNILSILPEKTRGIITDEMIERAKIENNCIIFDDFFLTLFEEKPLMIEENI